MFGVYVFCRFFLWGCCDGVFGEVLWVVLVRYLKVDWVVMFVGV